VKHDLPGQIDFSGATRQQKLLDNAIEILRLAEPPEGYFLATSFGKDSIVAQRVCDEAGVKYDAHNSITGLDPPELIRFGQKYYPDVDRIKPNLYMGQLILKKKMLPLRQARYCCEYLKEDKGHGRRCIMGIRASESQNREKSYGYLTERTGRAKDVLRWFEPDEIVNQLQSCATRGKMTVSPLLHWNDTDLWDFIHDRKIPYCDLYDQGFHRLGCIGCPMQSEHIRRYEYKRWPGFKKQLLFYINKLMETGRFTSMRNAEEVFEWWISDVTQSKPIEGQIDIEGIME